MSEADNLDLLVEILAMNYRNKGKKSTQEMARRLAVEHEWSMGTFAVVADKFRAVCPEAFVRK